MYTVGVLAITSMSLDCTVAHLFGFSRTEKLKHLRKFETSPKHMIYVFLLFCKEQVYRSLQVVYLLMMNINHFINAVTDCRSIAMKEQ